MALGEIVKLLTWLVLAFGTGGAFAQALTAPPANWKVITGKYPTGCIFYVDPSTTQKVGAYKAAWFMNSCEAIQQSLVPGNAGFMSSIFLYYFNCADRTTALVQIKYYSGSFGNGVVIDADDWSREPIFEEEAPNSVGEAFLRIACDDK